LIVTDPPYGVRYQNRFSRTVANDDDPSRILGAFIDLYRVLKPDSLCISFYGWGLLDDFFAPGRARGFGASDTSSGLRTMPRTNASCVIAMSRRSDRRMLRFA